MPTTDIPKPSDNAGQPSEGLAPKFCSALDWLTVSLRQLENAVCEMSADPNSPSLLACRKALRNAEQIIEGMNQPPMICPYCKSELLWSEDRGPHCDGCDDFDPETDLPNVKLCEGSGK